jgi:hypothetical protein
MDLGTKTPHGFFVRAIREPKMAGPIVPMRINSRTGAGYWLDAEGNSIDEEGRSAARWTKGVKIDDTRGIPDGLTKG